MKCTLTKDNLTKEFIDKKVLEPGTLKIKDKSSFNQLNNAYSTYFNDRYFTEGKPFKREGIKAIPNVEYLSELDRHIHPAIVFDEQFEEDVRHFQMNKVVDQNYNFKAAGQDTDGVVLKMNSAYRTEEYNKKIYEKVNLYNRGITEDQIKDSFDDTQSKIELMQKAFDAVVLIDRDLDASGALLSSDHPLSKANDKPVILINPDKMFSDTVFHEFGHLYIDLLGGLEDPVVKDAIDKLEGGKLWNEVAEDYPELQGQDLAKEVLATALGYKTDELFSNPEERSTWQAIKDSIMKMLERLFNFKMKRDALEQLATEMLTNKTRFNHRARFTNLLTQLRKYKVEKSTQEEADRIFKELDGDVQLEEEDHTYIKDGEVYDRSTTDFAKRMIPGYTHHGRKGSPDIELTEEYTLTEDNIDSVLSERYLPLSLDMALQRFFRGNIGKGLKVNIDREAWNSYYEETKMEPENHKQIKKALIDNIDAINDEAERLNSEHKKPLVMGDYVHKAIERYIKNREPFPENVNDPDKVLFKKIKKIIDEGEAKGSKFYPEQKLFSEVAKLPGTADLIEITKDGKYRIYDFKTTDSIRYYDTEDIKSMKARYVWTGYLHQLMIYATILEEYGLERADDHMNVLHVVVNRDSFDMEDPENSPIDIEEILLQNLDPRDKYLANDYQAINKEIIENFKSPEELKSFDLETKEDNVKQLIEKIQRGLKDYRRLTQTNTGKFTNDKDKIRANRILYQLQDDIKKHIGSNNSLVLYNYINSMQEAIVETYEHVTNPRASLTKGYIQNIDYLLQVSEFIDEIKEMVEYSSDNFELEELEKQEVIQLLADVSEKANQLFTIHKTKARQFAIQTLARNSNFQEGRFMERYELEAKKKGKKTKAEVYEYVYDKIRKNAGNIMAAETQYWSHQFRDGYMNLRSVEHLFADPGINKSLFVQTVKNILDKVDYDIRIDIDRSIPEIVKWHDKLSFNKKGNPEKVWSKFLEKASYKNDRGEQVSFTHGSVIPEYTSEARETYLEYQYRLDDYERLIRKAYEKDDKTLYETLVKERDMLRKERSKEVKSKDKTFKKHPQFEKLNKEEQEALRFIHKKLEDADDRLIGANHKRLVKELGHIKGAKIYNLPRMRKTQIEMLKSDNFIKNYVSKIKDIFRPPADEDDLNLQNGERFSGDQNVSNTDIQGQISHEIPVFYRNMLEDPELQSFDIPTLLALNEETTISYEHKKRVEEDLFMITSALKNSTPNKTDEIISGKVVDHKKGFHNKILKDKDNLVLKNIQASIDNRFYKRAYKGTYSRAKYIGIQIARGLSSGTSKLLLTGNFRSAAMTSIQGVIYRSTEALAKEHFTVSDAKRGTMKVMIDLGNVIKDTQQQFPESKTNLLIRRFGLDTQYKALTNKFVQDNFFTKNMDESAMFTVTSIAENLVTANLMYSMMNNIKVMNDEGRYIDDKGKVTTRDKAMSLDEAYTVENGELVLHPEVGFTERNLTTRFNDPTTGEKTIAAREISGYIRSVYADLYGQYNQELKSNIEMTVLGNMAMSMKRWFVRGAHRRWRGITNPFMTFEELRNPENFEKRFYSQDQKKFQEGFHVTGFRFLYSIIRDMKKNASGLMGLSKSRKNVLETMTYHEKANLIRSTGELATIALTFVTAVLAMKAISALDDDDERNTDYIYFLAYIAERLKIESMTFIWPPELMSLIENPAAAISTIKRITDLLDGLAGWSIDENGELDANINNRYERGIRKGELKIFRDIELVIPGRKDWLQFKGIITGESSETIEDSYTYLRRW